MLPMSGISLTPINVISSGHKDAEKGCCRSQSGVLSRGKQCPKSIQEILIAMSRRWETKLFD